MPVSKKRKKDGKAVQRTTPAHPGTEHAHGPEGHPASAPTPRAGKPANPFVAQQSRRASQRGR